MVQGPESFSGKNYAEALREARLENEAAERALAEQSAAFHSLRARGAAGLDEIASVRLVAMHWFRSCATAQPVYAAFVERRGERNAVDPAGCGGQVEALVAE